MFRSDMKYRFGGEAMRGAASRRHLLAASLLIAAGVGAATALRSGDTEQRHSHVEAVSTQSGSGGGTEEVEQPRVSRRAQSHDAIRPHRWRAPTPLSIPTRSATYRARPRLAPHGSAASAASIVDGLSNADFLLAPAEHTTSTSPSPHMMEVSRVTGAAVPEDGIRLRVRVLDDRAEPVAGASITVAGPTGRSVVLTNEFGIAGRVYSEPGRYDLIVGSTPRGYTTGPVEPQRRLPQGSAHGAVIVGVEEPNVLVDLRVSRASRLRLRFAPALTDVRDLRCTISARVAERAWRPVRMIRGGQLDRGVLEVPDVVPSELRVSVWSPTAGHGVVNVAPEPGETVEITATLSLGISSVRLALPADAGVTSVTLRMDQLLSTATAADAAQVTVTRRSEVTPLTADLGPINPGTYVLSTVPEDCEAPVESLLIEVQPGENDITLPGLPQRDEATSTVTTDSAGLVLNNSFLTARPRVMFQLGGDGYSAWCVTCLDGSRAVIPHGRYNAFTWFPGGHRTESGKNWQEAAFFISVGERSRIYRWARQ